MDQNAKKTGFINWAVLLAATAGLLMISIFVNSAAGIMGAILSGIGFLVAILSYVQVRLEERERFEKLEIEEIARSRGSASLFETAGEDTFPARRSREQFERYIVPFFTGFLCLLQAAAVFFPWKLLPRFGAVKIENATLGMALLCLIALVLLLLGKYASGLARLEGQRLLRPGANYCLLVAYAVFAVVGAIAAVWADFPKADLLVARILCIVVGLTGLETLLGLIMEIYRVRVKGGESRVLYESRLVGLLGKPEAILTTAAHALDYQFGFKVSETWFYRFLEKAFPALVLAQFIILFLSDCVVFIEPGEQGLIEHMGGKGIILNPGLHFKAPRPIDHVYRYRTEQIQSFVVGSESGEEGQEEENVVTWTQAHAEGPEFNMVVASTNHTASDKAPPVNLISASVTVQYQITNLAQWAYANEEPDRLLKMLGMREMVRYLASADLFDLMTHGRQRAGEVLQQRIQDSAIERQLGVKILFAGVEDIHPPMAVAANFEEVINATQAKETAIKNAVAAAGKTNTMARAHAGRILAEARAVSSQTAASAQARVDAFASQLGAYKAAGEVYLERTYLRRVGQWMDKPNKIVVGTTNASEIVQFNFEDKLMPSVEGLSGKVSSAKKN